MTTYLSRVSAIKLLRVCLSQARTDRERAQIVGALMVLGESLEGLPSPEGREDIREALIRALRGLPSDDRALVLSEVQDAPPRGAYCGCGADALRIDPSSGAIDCIECGATVSGERS